MVGDWTEAFGETAVAGDEVLLRGIITPLRASSHRGDLRAIPILQAPLVHLLRMRSALATLCSLEWVLVPRLVEPWSKTL